MTLKTFGGIGWVCSGQVWPANGMTRILNHTWPFVKRYSDVTTLESQSLSKVDIIIGGDPCQHQSLPGRIHGRHYGHTCSKSSPMSDLFGSSENTSNLPISKESDIGRSYSGWTVPELSVNPESVSTYWACLENRASVPNACFLTRLAWEGISRIETDEKFYRKMLRLCYLLIIMGYLLLVLAFFG